MIGIHIKQRRDELGMTQKALAQRLKVSQQVVARYESKERLKLEVIVAVEDALDMRRGDLLRLSGYVDDQGTFEQVLDSDPDLDDEARADLRGAYKLAVSQSSARARLETIPGDALPPAEIGEVFEGEFVGAGAVVVPRKTRDAITRVLEDASSKEIESVLELMQALEMSVQAAREAKAERQGSRQPQ